MLVLGILLIVLGLMLPALSNARRSAQATACLADLRGMGTSIALYAGDARDRVPFVYSEGPRANTWRTIGGNPETNVVDYTVFSTAGDFWAYPMLDDYGGSFIAEPLLCPRDVHTLEFARWVSNLTGTPVERVGVPLNRAISRSFYHRPRALAQDRVSLGPEDNRVAKLGSVRYPANKALLVENLPYHHPGFSGPEIPQALYPIRQSVLAADFSAALRSGADAVDPVVIGASPALWIGESESWQDLVRPMNTYHYTRDGVHGRDW